ncbi:hypothetical protein BDV96DRAFT_676188 [Lophiotrema nucula]|uniref:RING-type domain-containing protein n=1 Tax=Lophiotrema nucula TaxID=690887 RepID=A0A6A5ZI64_9PLEO|nr:hypothetical protein BDV96DRAFT_676188 [Lophiotrema nucula]
MLSPPSPPGTKRARSDSVVEQERPAKRLSIDLTEDTPPPSPTLGMAHLPANAEVIDLTDDTPPPTPRSIEKTARPKTRPTPIPANAEIVDLTQEDEEEQELTGLNANDLTQEDEDEEDFTGFNANDFYANNFPSATDDERERSATIEPPAHTLDDGLCLGCHDNLAFGEGKSEATFVANNCKAVFCGFCIGGFNKVICPKHPFPVQEHHKLLESDCVLCWEDKSDRELLDLPCGHPVCVPCIKTWAKKKADQDAEAKGQPTDVDARGTQYYCGLCPGSKGVAVDECIEKHGYLRHEEDRF